jgi:hypothetical protein
VELVGTDVYDWYGGPHNTYPHTASGQLDHDARWREILTQPGGLDWLARLSTARPSRGCGRTSLPTTRMHSPRSARVLPPPETRVSGLQREKDLHTVSTHFP